MIRILTENKNETQILEMVKQEFESFTILRGIGVWKGKLEESLIIEIEDISREQAYRVSKLLDNIKKFNNQEKILLQFIDSYPTLV